MVLRKILSGRLARGSASAMLLQIAEAGLGFLTAVLLGRALGAEQYGAYSFAIALAGLLTIPALLGYNALAVREVAVIKAEGEWTALRAFCAASLRRVLALAGAVYIGGVTFFAFLPSGYLDPVMHLPVLVGLALVPVSAVLKLHEGFLRGTGRVFAALLPDKGVRPALFFMIVVTAILVHDSPMDGMDAVALNLVATSAGLGLILIVWRRGTDTGAGPSTGVDSGRARISRAAPFAWIAGVTVLNSQTDIVMLGFLSSPEDTGVYRIASRVATLVAFASTAVAFALGPRIAALHSTGRHGEIQELAAKAALASTALALPLLILFLFYGRWVLLPFGAEFQEGASVLAILSVGQLSNALMGHVQLMLAMTGHERVVARTLTATALLNVLLNGFLIPRLGADGAAIATSAVLLVWNTALALFVRRILGVNPTILGGLGLLRRKRSA